MDYNKLANKLKTGCPKYLIHLCSVSNMEMFNQVSWPSPIGGRQVIHGI